MNARRTLLVAAVAAASFVTLRAQQPASPPATPRAAAPIDLTGTWVSLVTEEWR